MGGGSSPQVPHAKLCWGDLSDSMLSGACCLLRKPPEIFVHAPAGLLSTSPRNHSRGLVVCGSIASINGICNVHQSLDCPLSEVITAWQRTTLLHNTGTGMGAATCASTGTAEAGNRHGGKGCLCQKARKRLHHVMVEMSRMLKPNWPLQVLGSRVLGHMAT